MICKKTLTRVSKTRVLLESRVLETRDAIIINSSRTGQLTILLDKHCYLARGFHDTTIKIGGIYFILKKDDGWSEV